MQAAGTEHGIHIPIVRCTHGTPDAHSQPEAVEQPEQDGIAAALQPATAGGPECYKAFYGCMVEATHVILCCIPQVLLQAAGFYRAFLIQVKLQVKLQEQAWSLQMRKSV